MEIGRLKQEHSITVEPMRRAAQETLPLERRLSDLVNAAYGLYARGHRAYVETAPPRMPLTHEDR